MMPLKSHVPPLCQLLRTSYGSIAFSPNPPSPDQFLARANFSTSMHSQMLAHLWALVLSSVRDGKPGTLSQAGNQLAETLGGPKPLALSFSSKLSSDSLHSLTISRSTETTMESSKVGGKVA